MFVCLFIYFLREKQSVSREGGKREGNKESEAGSRLRAVGIELNARLQSMNCEIMT